MSTMTIKLCEYCNSEPRMQRRKKCYTCYSTDLKKSEKYQEYLKSNHDAHKKYMMKKYYGITQEQFNKMLEDQDNKCAICLVDQSQLERRMNIDHDHNCCPGKETCGKCIRGLLCGPCNLSLGAFKDDKMLLERAIMYIERFGG